MNTVMNTGDYVYMKRERGVLKNELIENVSLDYTVCTLVEEGTPGAELLGERFMVMDALTYHPTVIVLEKANVPDYSDLSLASTLSLVAQCALEYGDKAMILVQVDNGTSLDAWRANDGNIDDECDFLGLCCILVGFKYVNHVIAAYEESAVYMYTSNEILEKSGLLKDLNETM